MGKKYYSPELKEKVIKEFQDTRQLTEVCRANSVPVTTARVWILKAEGKEVKGTNAKRNYERLEKMVREKDLEISFLKELLKKTNQAWLKD